jgi:hypothetical protein
VAAKFLDTHLSLRCCKPRSCEGYGASKAGLCGLTHAQAMTLSGRARVNCVLPGWIDTEPDGKGEHSEEDKSWHACGRVGVPGAVCCVGLHHWHAAPTLRTYTTLSSIRCYSTVDMRWTDLVRWLLCGWQMTWRSCAFSSRTTPSLASSPVKSLWSTVVFPRRWCTRESNQWVCKNEMGCITCLCAQRCPSPGITHTGISALLLLYFLSALPPQMYHLAPSHHVYTRTDYCLVCVLL